MMPLLFSLLTLLSAGAAAAAGVHWIEAESYRKAEGECQIIEPATPDYGAMARNDASGERFVRFGPGVRLTLPPVALDRAGEYAVWIRAFPLPGRSATVAVDGQDVGSSPGGANPIALVWSRLGTARLGAGQHTVELRAAEGNTNLAYVDVVALLADPDATPLGSSPADVVPGSARVDRIAEDFTTETLAALAPRWHAKPPPGDDAVVEMLPREDDGVLHVHNGAGQPFSVASRQVLSVKPGDQVTVRLRARKGTLVETLSIVLPGVGSLAPQLYKEYRTVEHTWLVPPGFSGPVVVQLVGRGGGDTYLSRVEVFRPDPPLSPFDTGRFLPAPSMEREGRLFEIERYVVDADAFTTSDADGDGRWSLCRLSREANAPLLFSRGTVLKSDTVTADRAAPDDGCPPLRVRVGPLEPGRYQVHLGVPARALALSLDGKEWRRLPGGVRPDLGVVVLREPTFEFWLDDRYAEPGNPGPAYVDFIRFLPIEDPAYTMAPAPAPKPPRAGSARLRRVPLAIVCASGRTRPGEPVRSGVPIPRGELADAAHARLVDPAGRELPAHAQVTGRWPDGSVKWLLLDFEAPVAGEVTLEYGTQVRARPVSARLRVGRVRRSNAVQVSDGGPLRAQIHPGRGGCFELYYPPEGSAPALSLAEVEVRAADGRAWRASLDRSARVEVEEQNPLRATVRVRGRLGAAEGPGPIAYDVRLHLFAGRPEVGLEYGIFLTEAEEALVVTSATLTFTGPAVQGAARFGLAGGESDPIPVAGRARLLQTGGGAHGAAGPFPYALRDAAGKSPAEGERAPGWVRLSGGSGTGGALFTLPHFWEQFPKGLTVGPEGVRVELWPEAEGVAPFVMHAGAGKSHRIGISLDPKCPPERWRDPLYARADPEWYCASGAFEAMVPRRAGAYQDYEAAVDAGFAAMLRDRAGYGVENWGDVWQGGYVPGAKTWSNQEWDLANNWVIPFVRTGNLRFLDYAHEAARHFADVDCIHHARNPALVGGAWMHAHTSLEGHQLESPNFAHAGWVEGMLNLYHLTGDRRGLEAAEGIARYVCRMAPQADKLPPGGPPYSLMIQRPAGWPLTTLCLMYRETWDPLYLQTARRIVDYARRCQDPERGIWDAQTGHEVPYRGGCVFAFTLFRGLRLFADLTGEARARQDYVHAARWIFGEMWRPDHRYLYEQCPLHEPGARVPFLLSEMGGYATTLSGDPLYAAIAYDCLRQHAAGGAKSWMAGDAGRCQWGNGILQQVPRLLGEWERTGLSVDPRLTLAAAARTTPIPPDGVGRVRLILRNDTGAPLTGISASCLIRGDWKAEVAACPREVPAGAMVTLELTCAPPPPLAQYELQSDLAHVHVLVRGTQGGRPLAVWGWARLDIAKALPGR